MKNKIFLLFASILLIITACQPQATPSPLSAALSEVSGKVEAKQAGQQGFTSVIAGTVLEVNGQIQTGDDGRVRLDLNSGTIIRVAPSSSFTLTANDKVDGGLATQIKLTLGSIFIILNGGTASVDTPTGVATVRGSYMHVEVDPTTLNVYVTCLEGDCSASNPSGKINFTQGQKTILFQKDPVTGNWTIPNVEPMTPEDFQKWLDANPEVKELFNQAMATMTAMAEPTAPPTEPTEPPTEPTKPPIVEPSNTQGGGTGDACLNVIEPVAGSSLPFQGKVKFQWEPKPGAQKYTVTFKNANGTLATFETTDTTLEKYVEAFVPKSGDYSWEITAYGEDGTAVCTTPGTIFSKPDSFPKPDKPQEDPPAATMAPSGGGGG